MHLYHLTVQPPQAIKAVVVGNFAGHAGRQEAIVVRGTGLLEVWSLGQRGQITVLASQVRRSRGTQSRSMLAWSWASSHS